MAHKGNKRERKRSKKKRRAQETEGGARAGGADAALEDGSAAVELAVAPPSSFEELAAQDADADDVADAVAVPIAVAVADAGAGAVAVEVDLTELAQPIPEPPPSVHAPRTKSGFAPRMPEPARVDDDTLTDHLVSLQPLYRRGDAAPERADELVLQDLSLTLDGSPLGSPLASVPPVRARDVAARAGKLLAIALLALSSGYGVWSALQRYVVGSGGQPAATQGALASQAVPSPTAAQPSASAQPPARRAPASVTAPAAAAAQAAPAQPLGGTALTEARVEEAQAPVATEPPSPVREDAPSAPAAEAAAEREATGKRAGTPRLRAPAPLQAPTSASAAAPSAPSAPASAAAEPAATEEGAPVEAQPAALPAPAPAVLPAAEPLPKLPSRATVRASFSALSSPLRACVGGRQGLVTIRAVVSGSGRLSSGTVEGVFETPEERACMTRVLLQLQMPPFQQDVFKVDYPLSL